MQDYFAFSKSPMKMLTRHSGSFSPVFFKIDVIDLHSFVFRMEIQSKLRPEELKVAYDIPINPMQGILHLVLQLIIDIQPGIPIC